MSNPWQWWQDARAGKIDRRNLNEANPQTGYYRVKLKGRDRPSAVKYWRDGITGIQRCLLDGVEYRGELALDIWVRASQDPVSEEAYDAFISTGNWPDQNEVVTILNRAPDDDSFEGIQAAIDALESEAKRYIAKGAAKTKAEADAAANVANKLGKLWKRADAAREREKHPHLQAGRDVDDKWRPVLTAATIYERLKKIVCKPFLDAEVARKAKAEAEARRIAEEAAAAARKAEVAAAREAEAAARLGNEEAAAAAERAAEAAAAANEQAAAATQHANDIAERRVTVGTRGSGVHLRKEIEVEIEDRKAMLTFFEDRQEITDCLLTMAKAAVRAGITVPGAKINHGTKAA